MKKIIFSVLATTAFWAVVGFSLLYFDVYVLLTAAYADAIDLQTNQMAGAIDQLMQALWACKHST